MLWYRYLTHHLHCSISEPNHAQGSLSEALYATKLNETIHFDYIYTGRSAQDNKWLLVTKDDASKFS